ncbi:MAG: lactococcin 972 family bacteriocin [Bacilli bacterium]|nr:lactococcin 972 family bacteriocin [Bacilli bacterium]
MKKIIPVFVIIMLFIGTSIFATTVKTGGGTWEYGSALQLNLSNKCWSNYYHQSKTHGASCTMGSGNSGIVKVVKGKWANSGAYGSITDRPAYYHYIY